MKVSAAILAGGHARRFGGRNKGSLAVGGRTILERQIAELSTIAGELLLVGTTSAHPGVTCVADLVPGCGPLGGLHAALTYAAHDVTLVVACDMPYLSAPFLAHLAALAGDYDAVVPRTEDGYHPLCAAYTRRCLDPVTRHLAAERLKMTDLLAEVRVRFVATEEIRAFGDHHRLLANVNTPAAYRGLEALHNHEL